jgi:hypothetical protein
MKETKNKKQMKQGCFRSDTTRHDSFMKLVPKAGSHSIPLLRLKLTDSSLSMNCMMLDTSAEATTYLDYYWYELMTIPVIIMKIMTTNDN